MNKLALLIVPVLSLSAQVTFDRILNAGKEPQNWLTYSGGVSSQRYSTLNQITPDNVKNLELQWIFQSRSLERYEATPLVVDGVMYTVQNPDDVLALDTKTGKEAWRFYTIPGPGEPGHESWKDDSWQHGGASVWVTGSYDPDTNLTFWGIGNPGPDWNGDNRAGDNLYACSVVALDADTGKLKWYYQFSPHDEFDYDATQIPVLADIDWQGKPRKVMMWANRNGLFYVLDRTTGQFLSGKSFVKVNWMNGFDERGRPMKVASAASSKEGTLIYPGNQGGTNWYSPSFSPHTGLFYIPVWDNYSSLYVKQDQDFVEGRTFGGGGPRPTGPATKTGVQNFRADEDIYGAVRAIDPKTGDKKWEFKMADVTEAGILTTASDVLFTGGHEGYFFALDARNGKLLWKSPLGGEVRSGPMTYMVNGRQYVAVDAGNSLFVWALRQ